MAARAQENVIRMDDYKDSVRRLSPTESISLLHDCRDMAVERLPQSIRSILDKVQDALCDLGDKTQDDALRRVYYDAMQELRAKRNAIEGEFKQHYLDGFNKEAKRNRNGEEGSDEASSDDDELELSLLEDDDLEEALAIENMIASIKTSCKQELFGLNRRMGLLLNDPGLEKADHPMSPEVICFALKEACKEIESRTDVRIVILRLFSKYIANEVDGVYQQINDHLVKKEVLPSIRPRLSSRSKKRGSEQSKTQDHSSASGGQVGRSGPSEHDILSTLQQLMSANIARGEASQHGGQTHGQGVPIVDVLTKLQHGNAESVIGENDAFDLSALENGSVNILRDLKAISAANSISHADDMTIDIVAMLFDYILDDESVPDTMKALIGRLQIPVLKVALLDKALFSKKSHPARRLLNTLADAAIGWSEDHDQDDSLYKKVHSVVHRILDEFDDNVNIFAELADELDEFVADEEKKARERAEQSAIAIHAKEQLNLAKALVRDELKRRISEKDVGEFERQFLANHWKQALFVTCVKKGEDSPAWKAAIETMDELIWSISPKRTAEDRNKLVKLLPRLLKLLNSGLNLTSIDPTDRKRFFGRLARRHIAAVRLISNTSGLGRSQANTARGQVESALDEMSAAHTDKVEDREKKQAQDKAAHQAEEKAVKGSEFDLSGLPPEMTELLKEGQVEVEEIVLGYDTRDDATGAIEEHYIDMVTGLQVGTWLAFFAEDGTSKRARLTYVSPDTGEYLFTDRQGMKVATKTLYGLAIEFRRGSVTIIEAPSNSLFDRAVTNIMDRLSDDETLN